MTLTVQNILDCLQDIAPFRLAEHWDNNGLLVGSKKHQVTSILVGLDPSIKLLEEAIARGCNTVITHHPAIFKPLPAIDLDTPTGYFIQIALANSINIIACHTNLDSAADGVSDALGRKLGVHQMTPILKNGLENENTGMGRFGKLDKPASGDGFLQNILTTLQLQNIQVAGKIPDQIQNVAICGGSGSEFAPKTQAMGADIYITSEVKHSTARWAEETSFCIVDGTHYSTEQFAVSLLHDKLSETAQKYNWQLTIRKTETERHPFVSVSLKK